MKILKQIFLIAVFAVGASTAVSAQDKDKDKRPPKNPPVIVPNKEKDKPKDNQPKDNDRNKDNRGKKPQMVLNKAAETIEIAYF